MALPETNLPSGEESEGAPSHFDIAFQKTYQNIIDISAAEKWKRYSFNYSQWTIQTGGGLVMDDVNLLGRVYYDADSIFEFGLGESTFIAAETNVPRYAGVDSNPMWVSQAREGSTATPVANLNDWGALDKVRKWSHFRFYFADIGPTGSWGYPTDTSQGDVVKKDLRDKVNALNHQFSALQAE
jgi:hypothetical protein